MRITIAVIKTPHGWNYRNRRTRRLVGTVNKFSRIPGKYAWECSGGQCRGLAKAEDAHSALRRKLDEMAIGLGLEGNEYI